tara:strand:+ start:252 stop:1376 length:1125 start_codon:yes stop_codon:yes gene_type:complete
VKYVLYFFSFLILSCNDGTFDKLSEKSADLKSIYIPDSRVNIFDVNFSMVGKSILVSGETSVAVAKNELFEYINQNGYDYIDSIKLLPNYKYRYGIVNNSVGNLRGLPSHSSELVSQAVLGTKLKILKREGEWYLVQTPDDYISWIDHGGIHVMEESGFNDYFKSSYIFTDTYGFSYTDELKKDVVSDIVMGSKLNVVGLRNDFYEVSYPDGRLALIEKNKLLKENAFDKYKNDKNNLLEYSKKLIGIPYLWGGTSTKGFDCSGFTKTLYSMNGYVIPRDASQQINEGLTVDSLRDWSNLQVGDLLFFGYERDGRTRIDHVAMWVGDNKFIQASKNVRINSVDELSEDYDKYHMEKYIKSKRYLGNITDGIKDL